MRRALLLAVLLVACGRDADAPKKAIESEVVAPDDLSEKLRHCPLTVPGAKSEITDVEGGVRVTVSADTDGGAAEVRRRAQHLVEFAAGRTRKEAHGAGKGGGFMRNCPIVTKDTRVTAEDIDGGSALTIAALDPAGIDALRAETRARRDRLQVPAR
ncbi:MAG TPA: hypothetical protein VMZ28_28500 [Kofleriaceae bacterium]|nr:hypothetical protein [Kofleriaceae bacterium]